MSDQSEGSAYTCARHAQSHVNAVQVTWPTSGAFASCNTVHTWRHCCNRAYLSLKLLYCASACMLTLDN